MGAMSSIAAWRDSRGGAELLVVRDQATATLEHDQAVVKRDRFCGAAEVRGFVGEMLILVGHELLEQFWPPRPLHQLRTAIERKAENGLPVLSVVVAAAPHSGVRILYNVDAVLRQHWIEFFEAGDLLTGHVGAV